MNVNLTTKGFEDGMKMSEKPPIGCKPEILYEEQRLRDLAEAINDYVSHGFFGGKYAVTVGLWCNELSKRLKDFR